MSEDNVRVTLITTFWHPRFGLVMYHIDEDGCPFVMWARSVREEYARVFTAGYVDALRVGTVGSADVSLN